MLLLLLLLFVFQLVRYALVFFSPGISLGMSIEDAQEIKRFPNVSSQHHRSVALRAFIRMNQIHQVSLPRCSRYVNVHAWRTKDFLNEEQCSRSESEGKIWDNYPNLRYWWLGWSRSFIECFAALQMQTMSIDRWRTNSDTHSCLFTDVVSSWRTIAVVTWFRQCHWSYGIGQRWTCGHFTAKGPSSEPWSKRSDSIISTFSLCSTVTACVVQARSGSVKKKNYSLWIESGWTSDHWRTQCCLETIRCHTYMSRLAAWRRFSLRVHFGTSI